MANVYTSLSNALWYTDKCEVVTTTTPVTYQVYATALGSAPAAGNIYSGPPVIGANEVHQFYVGVGNYVTVSGTGYTAKEIGGQTSAQAGVGNFVEDITTQVPVTSNLVLYYNPNDSASYPGTGTTINSLATTNLTGNMTNVTFTDPYFVYNGTSSTVSIADNAQLEPGTGDFTVEAWVYYSTIAGSSRVIVGKTNNGGRAADWGYGLRTAANRVTYFEVGNGTTSVNSPSFTVTTGQWYQVVGVWSNVDSNSIALYVNGQLIGSNSHAFASIKNTSNPLYIGSYNGGEYSQWFSGRTGIVRLYNAALTANQVLQNYNANLGIYS